MSQQLTYAAVRKYVLSANIVPIKLISAYKNFLCMLVTIDSSRIMLILGYRWVLLKWKCIRGQAEVIYAFVNDSGL